MSLVHTVRSDKRLCVSYYWDDVIARWLRGITETAFQTQWKYFIVAVLSSVCISTTANATINYVQSNGSANYGPTTVSSYYPAYQNVGDLNVVAIAFSDSTSTVSSVTDSSGNVYTLAIGPTRTVAGTGFDATSYVYYSKNIKAAAPNANTVTVTFNSATPPWTDVRVAEYSGVDQTNPVDVSIGSSGVGTSMVSSNITTANANEVIIATTYEAGNVITAGSGYTQRIATGWASSIEDKMVSSTGSYNATATQEIAGGWVMQVVAFKASTGITYSQGNYASPAPATTVSAPYLNAQIAGDLNVVVVGFQDAATSVNSVVDSNGNTYALAIGPTRRVTGTGDGEETSYIYYASNIKAAAANANTVTVTFNAAPSYPDLRIAEYTGISTSNPLDVTVGASGYGLLADTGSVTTTNANDLLIAGNRFQQTSTGPGAGYSLRIKSSYNQIIEDQIVTSVASYKATAPQDQNAPWVIQMAAFKAAAGGGGDSQAPTAPTGLTASVISNAQINLSWTASTDNVGVTGYRVERCQGSSCSTFAQISTPTTTSYSDTGLTASTSYSYRVRATDAAGNLSGYSGTASATTSAASDTTPPSAPTGLTATATSSTQINLSWTASTDNIGVTGYKVERCSGASCTTFAQISTPTTTTFSDTGLTASTTYRYQVRATDVAGNLSSYSSIASATTQATPDTTAPSTPTGLSATAVSSTQVNLSWTASTDNVGVTGYRVERCTGSACTTFAQISTPATTNYSDTGLTASTTYRYQVRATDAAGNLSSYSSIANATTSAPPDTTAPSAPTGVTATAASSTQINLSWTASTDNVGVTGYILERCSGAGCSTFTQIATPTSTSYSDTGLSASTSYSYRVRATDAAANLSAYSSTATTSTQAPPDTTAPSNPTSLSASATSGSQINVSWGAATDNVAVTGYLLERCQGVGCSTFAQIATPTSTGYSDTGLSAATSYSYRVKAKDAANNQSGYSNTASAATQTPPGTPTSLTITATSDVEADLSWAAAGNGSLTVSSYRIERCQGAGCSSFAQVGTNTATVYYDSTLSAGTSYTYRVFAIDSGGNTGGASNTATVTTINTGTSCK